MGVKKADNMRKIIRIIIISFLAVSLILAFALTGCKKAASTTTGSKIDVGQEETSTSGKGSQTTETTKAISKLQIAGNINILSGLEISDKVSNSRPFAIMINNSPEARPQSGLNKADVLMEVVDEGGITRLIGIFSSNKTDIIGPIRSARQYYAELARMFDPVYVFWGTYPEGYKLIENMDMDVLTPLGDTTGASSIQANISDGRDAWRDSSRVAPHNAYSSTEKLDAAAKNNGFSLEGGQSPLNFKMDAADDKKGTIDDIKIDFSTASFAADFKYDKSSNKYTKSTGGKPDKDRETNEALTFNNVIAVVTDIANSGDAAGHMVVRTTGSGKAFFFFDGNMVEGTWERKGITESMEFKDGAGNDVLFNRGSTYIGLVQGTDRVIY
ncbi:MAG: DUF3048 domain-containing protein [Cyanobacteria bacterium]|nr:DUF3048 domain-containing protein [Cyanobacteriota bacterium]